MYKDIMCFNVKPDKYVADEHGNIYVKKTMKKKKTTKNSAGYNLIFLVTNDGKGKCFLNHRVIMQTYSPIEHPETMVVNHLRGKSFGDGVDNLEWTTAPENWEHAKRMGFIKPPAKGQYSVVTDFTDEFVHLLCSIMEKHHSFVDIHEELQKHGKYIVILGDELEKLKRLVTTIRCRTAWVHISSNYNIIRNPKTEFGIFETEENIIRAHLLILSGYSNRQIAYIIFKNTEQNYLHYINSVRTGRTYKKYRDKAIKLITKGEECCDE